MGIFVRYKVQRKCLDFWYKYKDLVYDNLKKVQVDKLGEVDIKKKKMSLDKFFRSICMNIKSFC